MIARGRVIGARGGIVRASIPGARVGDVVAIATRPKISGILCAIDGAEALVAVDYDVAGMARGTPVHVDPSGGRLMLGCCALGRALNACGRPLDEGAPLAGRRVGIAAAPAPNQRVAVMEPFWTGVRAVDGLLTLGRGARVGVFGAPGAGKSTLIESIVAGSECDAVVVGLVGERGREARRWIDRCDGRTTIVCATSDRPASERVRATWVAAAQAAALRERGLHVLFVLDSLARVATALREIAVAAGESVGRGGYPPSVFADLARLVEIAGETRHGSITMIASVLSDGDDDDPVSNAARSYLDGHVALSSQLAHAGHFPAIDALRSTSRTMTAVVSASQASSAAGIRRALALLDRTDDARRLGIEPVDPYARRVLAEREQLEAFLRQDYSPEEPSNTLRMLAELAVSLQEPDRRE